VFVGSEFVTEAEARSGAVWSMTTEFESTRSEIPKSFFR
jgi:hypothetical protein